MNRVSLPFLLVCAVSCGESHPETVAQHGAAGPATEETIRLTETDLAGFTALPAHFHAGEVPSSEVIDLGRKLYFDPRLSADDTVSCNSCHALDRFGVDGEATSPGVNGTRGDRNSPTVFHAAGHLAQFWDGREPDVEAQAKGPILNPVEMAMPDAASVEAKLNTIQAYVDAFAAAFPNDPKPLNYDNLGIAIGAFERGLVAPARWDRFLAGDRNALTQQEKRGFLAFKKAGCQACHNGALLGGGMYQKLGLIRPYPNLHDRGRGSLLNDPAQDGVFKVPSLRNITKTGPYLHDGSIEDLAQVVELMAHYQADRTLTHQQIEDIVAFLGALEGTIDPEYTAKPALP